MRRALLLISVVLVLLVQRGHAQQLTLAWDPTPATDAVGYKVYARPGSDPVQLVGMLPITATITTLNVSYDTPYEFWLTAYNSEGLEGSVSNSAFGRVDSPAPPPPPPPPPTDTEAPVVTVSMSRNGKSANWTMTATAVDNVGVVRFLLLRNGQAFYTCGASPCAATIKVGKGTFTFTATATDAAGNGGQASQTITN